uniref:Uncharacterized protein n=1 Tax=Oryza rufipogon TaxID=4529 RepID=A0A0E0QLR3_ORYRU
MGRRKQQRQEAAADDDDVDVARNLRGMPWLVWLLFETPSGFAIFSFNSYIFEEENAIEAPRAHVAAAAREDDATAVGAGGEVQAVAGEVPDPLRVAEAGVVEEEGRALGGGAAVGHVAGVDAAMAEPAHRPVDRALLAPEAMVGMSRVVNAGRVYQCLTRWGSTAWSPASAIGSSWISIGVSSSTPRCIAMGRRGREKQQRQEAAADDVDVDVARNLRGMPWLVWLLFETPSGFAIFSFNSYIFEEENAIELWLKQFQKFEDKSAAINCTTGLGKELRDMLKIWCRRGEKLMVGSLEYKEIIEADQELKGVRCLYSDNVMEVMWGIKNLMHILVPEEQKVLTKEERLPITRPGEEIEHPPEMFSSDELLKIERDADKYKDKIYKTAVSKIWNELVRSYVVKKEKLRHMQFLVEAAAQEAAKREAEFCYFGDLPAERAARLIDSSARSHYLIPSARLAPLPLLRRSPSSPPRRPPLSPSAAAAPLPHWRTSPRPSPTGDASQRPPAFPTEQRQRRRRPALAASSGGGTAMVAPLLLPTAGSFSPRQAVAAAPLSRQIRRADARPGLRSGSPLPLLSASRLEWDFVFDLDCDDLRFGDKVCSMWDSICVMTEFRLGFVPGGVTDENHRTEGVTIGKIRIF